MGISGSRSPAVALWGFVGWTLFVWVSRLRNIWTDTELSAGGQLTRSLLAASFVILAGWVIITRTRAAVGVLAGWTTVVWLFRGVSIATGDHSAGFVAVHLVLAVISIGVATWAWATAGRYHRRRYGSADHRRRKAVLP